MSTADTAIETGAPARDGSTPSREVVGVLGASSVIGPMLLKELRQRGNSTLAFTRADPRKQAIGPGVSWEAFDAPIDPEAPQIRHWISAIPIWELPPYLPMLAARGARKVVALSTTSIFTRAISTVPDDLELVRKIKASEGLLRDWGRQQRVTWTILRPTLIYGRGRDRNISDVARFIRRFGFFPLLAPADGARQPVHAEDVARACCAALRATAASNKTYNISGDETLAFREMVSRVFVAMGRKPVTPMLPRLAFHLGAAVFGINPRLQNWSITTAERMGQDMAFAHDEAKRDFGFVPRPFRLTTEDLPS